jgi:hypothetical protein
MDNLKSHPKQFFNNVSKFWKKNDDFMLFDIDSFLNAPHETAETFSKYEYFHV